jgi:outer membrane protein TolC
VILFGCFASNSFAHAEASHGVKDTLALAVRKASSLEALRVERDIALGELETAEKAWMPRLELDSTVAAGAASRGRDQAVAHTTGLFLRSNLYDAGKTHNIQQEATAVLAIKDLELRLTTEELLLSVLKSFGELRLLRSSLSFEEESYRQLKEQALAIERAYKQGLKRQADYVKVELDLRSAEVRLAQLKVEIANKQNEIVNAVGLDDSASVTLSVEDWPPVTLDQMRPVPGWDSIESESPETMLWNARRDLERSKAQFARRLKLPDLTAQAFAGVRNDLVGEDFLADRENTLTSEVSLTLNYSIWDWGARDREVLAALAKEKIFDIRRREALMRLRTDHKRLVAERGAISDQLRLVREIQKRAAQSFALSKESYRGGSLSYLELADSYKRLLDARQSILVQENALQANIHEALKLRGKLHETWLPEQGI